MEKRGLKSDGGVRERRGVLEWDTILKLSDAAKPDQHYD